MKKYVIASFYKFVELVEYESLKKPILQVMNANNLLGTIILAKEGINGSVAGTRNNIDYLYHYLKSDSRFHDLWFKETHDDLMPFDKAKVKFRKEIVTMGVEGVSPLKSSGIHISPEQWNQLISDPNVLVIDTRNDYEVKLGTFKQAINPCTDNFREFPEYVKTHLMDKKDKKIAMFCTGGIRCEKSTAYLKELGFQEIYQLDGGILNYLDKIPEKESLWEGTCFVFDDRIAIEK
ncbi:rhodanese-related sulfurtransferase [Legionella nagasakiensis]|uniref:oxygen-dependent tRNA uridine(34) hydroxylase TrhO n=1 Tax=Legionella nagasakiensis TaxID=535290 RepID=UPI00105606BC|nr:rhodanese-related sulfurtransferase [Legionella nagasakiensis]